MKRTSMLLLLLLLLLVPLSASSWLGGYVISFDGYSKETLASSDEQIGLHMNLIPVQFGWFAPTVSLGVLMPALKTDVGPLIESSLTLQVFSTTNHLFAPIFKRPSAWQPSIQASLLNTIRGKARSTWAVSLHPFVFHFGEKRISLLAPRLLYETELQQFSWGVRLLEISHALY